MREEPVAESRGEVRKPVLLSGRIVYGDGAFSYDCSIRDISASGAKLAIRGATVLPKEFFLIDLKSRTAYECEVMWRNATYCGVRFGDAYDLVDLPDPALRFLRRHYLEACAR